ncbi:MAG: lipoyltransferase [Muribaculaceae bacterium]|nr:lipoyltransferase [Muribaculaceae bacterium]
MSIHRINLPHTGPQRLPFYLAAEEWIARNLPSGEYFFAWQVAPSVICGRHQEAAVEIDLDFCHRNNIGIYRRKSGGGAVYADMNNIMFSYVGPAAAVQDAFDHYTSRVVGALRQLGLEAEPSGRNDILIGGRKVAGNAFWRCGDRCIVHGTMLYDTDDYAMSHALTPSRAKLLSHKVLSVQSRVTTIKSYRPSLSLDDFMSHILDTVCSGSVDLPAVALPAIKDIEREYYVENFASASAAIDVVHVEGVGNIYLNVKSSGNTIEEVCLSGDFFCHGDLEGSLRRLRGITVAEDAIERALGTTPVVASLDNAHLARLIVNRHQS